MPTVTIENFSRTSNPITAKLANTFFSKLLGLMFRSSLPEDGGLLLSDAHDSRINSSIHMLFMNFDICAVWINSANKVVDVKLARKWRLAYFPKSPARHVLELHVSRFFDYKIGDQLQLSYEK